MTNEPLSTLTTTPTPPKMSTEETSDKLFPTVGEVVNAEDANAGADTGMQEVESMCMRCHGQGKTRLLLTSIPYFKEVVVSSFTCDECGYRDTEVQSAGEIQPKGAAYTVHCLSRDDLDRQLVKSNWATVTIPEVQLTIPPGRGQLSTIEGIIRDTVRDLAIEQPVRRIMDPETGKKIDELLGRLRNILDISEEDEDGAVGRDEIVVEHEDEHAGRPFTPFSITLDDPSGNSFLAFKESPSDPQWKMRAYNRTFEQNVQLGLVAPAEEVEAASAPSAAAAAAPGGPSAKAEAPHPEDQVPAENRLKSASEVIEKHRANVVAHEDGTIVPDEVFSFPSTCSSCGHELETLMKPINIPYFQDVILMSTNCYACGYRDTEVKSGGKISPKGKRIELKVEAGDEDALSRDLLKSDTCGLEIPEIDLVLQPGTLGGRFTTVEGILNEIYDELSTKVFRTGDSSHAGIGQIGQDHTKDDRGFETFLQNLKDVIEVKIPFTLILDDPVSNSYLQNLNAPEPDPDMTITEYERTKAQNDELGLSDMKVEGYNADAEGAK